MVQNISRKEKLYNIAINIGRKLFPEYWGKASLKATDRWIEYPWVLKNLPNSRCDILDVGCAGSMFPLLLKVLGYDTFGMDIQPHSMGNEFTFLQRDITKNIPYSIGFDVITAISTIEHIENDSLAINNIYRMLRSKGLFLMTVPFDPISKQTKFHRIYNIDRLSKILPNFTKQIEVVNSPETNDYKLALIKAYK